MSQGHELGARGRGRMERTGDLWRLSPENVTQAPRKPWFLRRREAGVCDWDGGTSCLSGFFGQQDLNNVGG